MVKNLISKTNSDFEWLDISNPNPEELFKIAQDYKLHPNLVKDCLEPEHLPKYENIEDIQFIILRVYDTNAASDCDNIQKMTRKIAIFIGPDFIITIHRIVFDFIQEIVDKYIAQTNFKNQYYIIHKLIQYSIETYNAPTQKLINDLDFYESKIFLKEKLPTLLKSLYLIKRKASVINKICYLIKPVLENLKDRIPSPVASDLQDALTASRISAEQIIENSNNLLNLYISLSSQRTNEVMRVLTIFSVFFMPLTFIAGIYGMNFEFMPELKMKWGYPGVLLSCTLITVFIYIWFKKKGWL